jgi:hypothetical protein
VVEKKRGKKEEELVAAEERGRARVSDEPRLEGIRGRGGVVVVRRDLDREKVSMPPA